MKKAFVPLAIVTAVMFAYAPIAIARVQYESTMLLVQKIFYFHVPAWFVMFTAIFISGIWSAIYLFRGDRSADRIAAAAGEIAVIFGLMGLVTGPLWGRKAWGVWWQWDAKLTMALLLEAIFIGDLMHHPIQCAEPGWSSCFCVDPPLAAATRRRFFESVADTSTIIVPEHFPFPTAGRIRSHGAAFRWEFLD